MQKPTGNPNWFKNFHISGPRTPARCLIGITAVYMPEQAFIAIKFDGPTGAERIDTDPFQIANMHDSVGWQMDLPTGFETEIEVKVWANGATLPPDADVNAYISLIQNPSLPQM